MIFIYDGTTYTLPDNLAGIPLTQQQAWSAAYGYAIAIQAAAARTSATPGTAQLKLYEAFMDEMTQALHFFSGIPIEDARANLDLSDVVTLLGESGIATAIQGPQMPVPERPLIAPATITIGGTEYQVYAPLESVTIESLTHEQFLCFLQLAKYLTELADGDWANFHNLAAGFVRLPSEALTLTLITPDGTRATALKSGMTMDQAAPLAQLFVRDAPFVLQILDAYTTQVLTPA